MLNNTTFKAAAAASAASAAAACDIYKFSPTVRYPTRGGAVHQIRKWRNRTQEAGVPLIEAMHEKVRGILAPRLFVWRRLPRTCHCSQRACLGIVDCLHRQGPRPIVSACKVLAGDWVIAWVIGFVFG